MDSLTQFALGAAVGAALAGKAIGPRKAALVGGVLGTIPDLDVFIPFDDPIDAFTLHRGWTHAFFTHALATPLLGEALMRLFKGLRDRRGVSYAMVFFCFTTHATIDAMTVYGTRIFWPFNADPVGIGSVFIIDPVYTIPLLVAVVWALCLKAWTARFSRGLAAALLFSSIYMAASVGLQAIIEHRARAAFAAAGLEPKSVFAIAAPFNTVLWKAIGLENDHYHNVYLSLFDDGSRPIVYTHSRRADLITCLSGTPALKKLNDFADGYVRAEEVSGRILVADLRMGLTPNYVFQFAIAERRGHHITPIPPQRYASELAATESDFDWLVARFMGQPSRRLAEAMNSAEDRRPQAC